MTLTEAPIERPTGTSRQTGLGEVPFEVAELFFSRTDGRGVIRAGNDVFRRVSGYGWDRLIGAPHKIVRHDLMPSGLFHLMWERLKAGRSTGAYVCNRAEDGRPYWVFSLVTPVEDGFVSVRLKPGSSAFAPIEPLYARLRAAERAGREPAESAAALLDELAALGHADYDLFQSEALRLERAHRANALGRRPHTRDALFAALADAGRGIERATAEMKATFEANRTIPMNLRVLSSRLGDLGRPISAISINYASLSGDMNIWLRAAMADDRSSFAQIRRSISRGAFYSNASGLLAEMATQFEGDVSRCDGIDQAAEVARLRSTCWSYRREEEKCVKQAIRDVQTMEFGVTEMKRLVTGLSSIRMLCKIESAVLRTRGGALDGIVDQLDAFQDEIERPLNQIMGLNHAMQTAASRLS